MQLGGKQEGASGPHQPQQRAATNRANVRAASLGLAILVCGGLLFELASMQLGGYGISRQKQQPERAERFIELTLPSPARTLPAPTSAAPPTRQRGQDLAAARSLPTPAPGWPAFPPVQSLPDPATGLPASAYARSDQPDQEDIQRARSRRIFLDRPGPGVDVGLWQALRSAGCLELDPEQRPAECPPELLKAAPVTTQDLRREAELAKKTFRAQQLAYGDPQACSGERRRWMVALGKQGDSGPGAIRRHGELSAFTAGMQEKERLAKGGVDPDDIVFCPDGFDQYRRDLKSGRRDPGVLDVAARALQAQALPKD